MILLSDIYEVVKTPPGGGGPWPFRGWGWPYLVGNRSLYLGCRNGPHRRWARE